MPTSQLVALMNFFVAGATEGSFVGGAKDDSGGALTSITQNSHVFYSND
jgi:hypothetical protein